MRVLYVQYTNPGGYPPIEHGARILADGGAEVLVLGTTAPDDAMVFCRHDRIEVRLMTFERAGWRQKLHYLHFAARAARWTRAWRPDWIYASDPLSCPVALLLGTVSRAGIVYHEHDSPGPRDGRGSVFMRAVLWARRAIARRADVCVLPNSQRAEAFSSDSGRSDVVTVWNCPLRAEVTGPREAPPENRLRVLYHGSIVPSRVPQTVFHALAQLPDGVSLDIVGYETVGHPGYVRALADRARGCGVANRVRFLGPVSRGALMRLCPDYDVGLALFPAAPSDVNVRFMVGASNKPFDYLAAGLAVLVPDQPDWRQTYVDAGFGLFCDSGQAHEIAAALRWFLENPSGRAQMAERGRQKILADWNYESVFAPVVARMRATDGVPLGDAWQRGGMS